MRSLTTCVLLILTLALPPAAADTAPIQDAIDRLDDAIIASDSVPDPEVLQAAAVLRDTFETQGVETSVAHLTLGNAYYFGGDIGRAVLHYQRGLAIDPSDETIRANLKTARNAVDPALPSNDRRGVVDRVVDTIRGVLTTERVWWIGLAAAGALGLLLTLRVSGFLRVAPRLGILAAGGVLALCGVLISTELYAARAADRVVILDHGVSALSGPGSDAYDAVYDAPLGPGTEAVVLEQRREWARVRLHNGEQVWIPGYAFERVSNAM